ncbi:MAG: ribonucleotide reductase N-terminal alpha domain-containing protein, partial [Caldilineaceae bacterium]
MSAIPTTAPSNAAGADVSSGTGAGNRNEQRIEHRNEHGAHTVIETVKGVRKLITPPAYVSDQSVNLPENSVKVLEKRYLRRDIDGSLLETPAGMFFRIAYHIGAVDAQHGGSHEESARTFYDLLTERRFYPNSPTFTGAGTPLGQLAACFVLPIADDMGK